MPLAHIELFVIYMLYTASFLGLPLAYTRLCIVYMPFTASIRYAFSTYRVILYYYVYFLQPLWGLPLAHIELFSITMYTSYSLFWVCL